MKILLCEDDDNIATIAQLTLEQMGSHTVIRAHDGEQALHKSQNEKFDLILLDDMMPKMSGVDVCRQLVAVKAKIAPVVFMSANPQEKNVQEFQSIVVGYIPKPFDPLHLCQQIEILIKKPYKQAL